MTTINIPGGTTLTASFALDAGDKITVNGPGTFDPISFGTFDPSTLVSSTATINANVGGRGVFDVSNITFGGAVGHGQTVDLELNGTITIDKPTAFKGTIGWFSYNTPHEGPFGEYVDLVGLAHAAGWSLKNDLLSITNTSGKVIDTLHIDATYAPVAALGVSKAPNGNVYFWEGYGQYRLPSGSVALPHH